MQVRGYVFYFYIKLNSNHEHSLLENWMTPKLTRHGTNGELMNSIGILWKFSGYIPHHHWGRSFSPLSHHYEVRTEYCMMVPKWYQIWPILSRMQWSSATTSTNMNKFMCNPHRNRVIIYNVWNSRLHFQKSHVDP